MRSEFEADSAPHTEASMSRNGTTNTGGKLHVRLELQVTEEIMAGLQALASAMGVPRAECTRTLIERGLFGDLEVSRRATDREARAEAQKLPLGKAIELMATLHGVSPREYETGVMERAIFGGLHQVERSRTVLPGQTTGEADEFPVFFVLSKKDHCA